MISGAQIRAARALLGWTQNRLAISSGVSHPTIQRMESSGTGRSAAGNVQKVEITLEAAGIEFIEENGGGIGVRFRNAQSST